MGRALALRPSRMALPHLALEVLLAGEPGAPWRRPTGAVVRGVLEDRRRVDDAAAASEAHHRGPAHAEDLAVRGVDPPAVRRREAGAAIRRHVPDVLGARHLLAGGGDHPRAKPLGQAQAVGVALLGERTVGPIAGPRRCGIGALPERRPQRDATRAGRRPAQKLSSLHAHRPPLCGTRGPASCHLADAGGGFSVEPGGAAPDPVCMHGYTSPRKPVQRLRSARRLVERRRDPAARRMHRPARWAQCAFPLRRSQPWPTPFPFRSSSS